MKKYAISFFLVIAFAFYAVLNNQSSIDVGPAANGPVAANTGPAANTPTGPAPTPTPTPSPTPTPTPAPTQSTGLYKNGSYVGSAADAYYGNVQVKAIVQNGALSNIQILQYPSDRGTSVRINSNALPQLVQEAIQAQSANVNMVSGATESSGAFQQSLASALAQAKA